MVRVAGFIIRSNEWVIIPKTDRANIPAVFAWWNVIGEISTTRTLIFFQDMITSANWNWDFIYSKGFNNCYILLSNISQSLENTKFIAGELSLIVSLVLYRPTSVYELWQGQIQGHKMSSEHLLCADRFTTSSGCWLWTDHSGTKSGSGDQENYIKQYNTK